MREKRDGRHPSKSQSELRRIQNNTLDWILGSPSGSKNDNTSKKWQWIFWITLALCARLIPHPPNFSPYASLIMLMGCQLSGRMAAVITFTTLLLSDIALAVLFNYPVFGSWSIFTYTGFIVVAFASYYFLYQHRTFVRIATFSLSAVLVYWLWTNFGTWLASEMYPHTATGLLACFVAGLPFLQNSFWSALIFEPLFFGLMIITERAWALKPR